MLNTQDNKVRIKSKMEPSKERRSAFPKTFGPPSTTVANLFYLQLVWSQFSFETSGFKILERGPPFYFQVYITDLHVNKSEIY